MREYGALRVCVKSRHPVCMLPVAILAGGLATRLHPVTQTIPKALVAINGEPFLAHQLRLLQRSGVQRVVLCIGFLGEQIREYAGDGRRFHLDIDYSADGPRLLGTAGAIRQALGRLGPEFLVLYGDSYLPCDYHAVEQAFQQSGKSGLMTVFRNEGQWDASNVEFDSGRILAYDKTARTSRMRYIDYGLGAFRATAFSGLPDQPSDLASVYQNLLAAGDLAGFEVRDRFYEIGSFQGVRDLEQLLEGGVPIP
jgi:N-acetyl-alpha-D-muramate 1-phosphate uridylyltransferase